MIKKAEIAATTGDPSSIGPEVAAKALKKFLSNQKSPHVCVRVFGKISTNRLRPYLEDGSLVLEDSQEIYVGIKPGEPNKHTGQSALKSLGQATSFVLEQTSNRSLVTGPVDKFICSKLNKTFKGQTEFLKEHTQVKEVTMLLAGKTMKVALVTTHHALKDVSGLITGAKIRATTQHLWDYLKVFKNQPKIAVCALNPHASDQGLFGDEEKQIIEPAIKRLQKKLNLVGPIPADSLFHRARDYDGIVCMYHDQGLIPLKMAHFWDAINITLGLPFLRVSVDHGTAFDIAGKGKASEESYLEALRHAKSWIQKTKSS